MSDTVELEILAKVDDAISEIKKLHKTADKELGGVEKSFSNLGGIGKSVGAAVAAVAAGFAALKIGQFLSDGIKAAAETEAALSKLGYQLQLSGDYSKEALQGFEDFADEIERTTNVSDDLVLSQATVAKAFGLTDQQTKELIRAATELSAVQGQDLSTSVDQLIKSYNGNSKALEAQVQGVRGLTKEQLAQGKAIELINEQLGGQASQSLNTYAGAMLAAENALGNIGKELGRQLIQNPQIVATIRAVTERFNELESSVKDNGDTFGSFVGTSVNGGLLLAEGLARALSVVHGVVSGVVVVLEYLNLGLGKASEAALDFQDYLRGPTEETIQLRKNLEGLQKEARDTMETAKKSAFEGENAFASFGNEAGNLRRRITELSKTVVDTSKKNKKAVQENKPFFDAEDVEKARRDFLNLSRDVVQIVSTETEKVNIKRREQLAEVDRLSKLIPGYEREASALRVSINEAASKQLIDIEKKQAEERRKEIQGIFSDPISVAFSDQSFISAGEAWGAAAAGVLGGAIPQVQQGKEGSGPFVSGIVGAIGAAFAGPEFAGLFRDLAELLQQDGDVVEVQVKGFVEGIPEVVSQMAKALPHIMTGILDILDEKDFWDSMFLAVRDAFVTWSGWGSLIKFIAKQLGIDSGQEFLDMVGGGFQHIWGQITDSFVGDIGRAIGQFATNAYTALSNLINNLATSVIGTAISNFARSIAESLGAFINGFVAAVQNTFGSIFETIGGVFSNFGEYLNNFFTGFRDLIVGFGDVIKNAFSAVGDFFKSIFEDIGDGLSRIFEPITKALGAVSGGSNGFLGDTGAKISGGFKQVFGFAEGGIVPPGFPNDSYPAFLTSGERVVPEGRSLPDESGNTDVMIAMLGKILAKLSEPMNVSTTAEVNGRALADIMLQLSRQNARLAGA